ncbi:YolD-like family protein [Bacillus nitratireducens]|uniref:YolD-like family protein n=1 Tax=Bacillus nitratireducens TaxID=2026193 RepID=UPI000BEE679B|nr:YolD-like family protein [Bacillus nitratireducens]PEE19020.1 3-oxoacyl-ACP synthase [Bacillus cereus]MED0901830.1 YolD-like family protein [Bacillus nitratireducens]PFH89668.1 3-oxoacyl-ACP synthase [Bacillus cereus]PFM57723.1 3-oxoacyl-ACP synthase [Bacillus cereus]PGS29121.1 3-oxoacyl-ACP synthase [Bacillus cereus]
MHDTHMPKEIGMTKRTPFASIPKKFTGIGKIVKKQTKVERPTLTQDEQEIIENKLICSFLSEEKILITYYRDGHLLTRYMTVTDINPIQNLITCIDASYNRVFLKFIDIINLR